jgi:hypothetical protein
MDQYEELVGRIASLEARVAGLESRDPAATAPRDASKDAADAAGIVGVQIKNKRYDSSEYQDHIWVDCVFTGVGLSRPTRAVKGVFEFCDLFGAPQFLIEYTLNERLEPGQSLSLQGIGFEYNQFISDHQWMFGTRLEDMTVRFRVDQILYEDGTSETTS